MIRALIADDHPLIRIGLRQLLTEDLPDAKVQQAASFPEVREALAREPFDLLVVDLNMPGGSSLEAIQEFRRQYPKLAILVLSIHSEHHAGVRSILAGANGYVNKNNAPEQLMDAVRQVLQGGRYVSPELGSALAEYLFRDSQNGSKEPHETLSPREFTILLKITEGHSTAQIAEALRLSPKTVGTYRARILDKMGISTTAELTRYVVERGLGSMPAAVDR